MSKIDIPMDDARFVPLDEAVLVVTSLEHFKIIKGQAPYLLKARYVLPLIAEVTLMLEAAGSECVHYWDYLGVLPVHPNDYNDPDLWKPLADRLTDWEFEIAKGASHLQKMCALQYRFARDVVRNFLAKHPDLKRVIVPSWNLSRPSMAEFPSDVGAAASIEFALRAGVVAYNVVLPGYFTPPVLHFAGVAGPAEAVLAQVLAEQTGKSRIAGRLRVAVDITWLYRPVEVAEALKQQGVETIFVLHGPAQPHHNVAHLSEIGPVYPLLRNENAPASHGFVRFPEEMSRYYRDGESTYETNNMLFQHRYFAHKMWPALENLSFQAEKLASFIDADAWLLPAVCVSSAKMVYRGVGRAGKPRIMMLHGIPFDPSAFFEDAEGYGFWSHPDAEEYKPQKQNAVKVVTGSPQQEEELRAIPGREELRRKLDLPADKKVILLVSSAIRLGDLPCVDFGDHLRGLKALFENIPADSHLAIRPKPYWDEPSFYPNIIDKFVDQRSAVSILPSQYEGSDLFEQIYAADIVVTLNTFSTVLLDCVRSGVPALCLANADTILYWDGIFSRVSDEGDFWSEIQAILADTGKYAAMQKAALSSYEGECSFSDKLFTLISAVVDAHGH